MASPTGAPPYTVVSVSPPPPRSQYRPCEIDMCDAKNSTVIDAQDGTMVTLYHRPYGCASGDTDSKRGDGWVISTTKGYEVNTYKCGISDRTYQDVLGEALAQYPSFSYDKLDTTKCYTLLFQHPDTHVFSKYCKQYVSDDPPKPRVWCVRVVDMYKFNNCEKDYVVTGVDIGIPYQDEYSMTSINKLRDCSRDALTRYLKEGHINYGYVITNNSTGQRYIMESSLMRTIRHIFYSSRYKDLQGIHDPLAYIAIDVMLDSKQEEYEFIQYLLPEMTKKITDLIDKLVDIMVGYKHGASIPVTRIEQVAYNLHKSFPITPDAHANKDVRTLLHAFMYNHKHTMTLYELYEWRHVDIE
jgi:hypothetical protein